MMKELLFGIFLAAHTSVKVINASALQHIAQAGLIVLALVVSKLVQRRTRQLMVTKFPVILISLMFALVAAADTKKFALLCKSTKISSLSISHHSTVLQVGVFGHQTGSNTPITLQVRLNSQLLSQIITLLQISHLAALIQTAHTPVHL